MPPPTTDESGVMIEQLTVCSFPPLLSRLPFGSRTQDANFSGKRPRAIGQHATIKRVTSFFLILLRLLQLERSLSREEKLNHLTAHLAYTEEEQVVFSLSQ